MLNSIFEGSQLGELLWGLMNGSGEHDAKLLDTTMPKTRFNMGKIDPIIAV